MSVHLAVHTPFLAAKASEAAGQLRKKLLPVGEISYKGRILKFTPDYLAGLVKSFRDQAYDQVPFQLAGDDNKHTNDVERFGGKITGMDLQDDGLWVTVEPTERGRAVLAANPSLGVSARIVESYDRADGKFFPRAIQHVLGTLDPRITGMGGWEAVAASNDAEITVDLSAEHYSQEEAGMPDLTEEQAAKLGKLLDLDPDKLAALASGLTPADAESLNGGGDAPQEGEPAEDDLVAAIDAMTDEELAELEAEMEAEEASEGEPATAGALSGGDQMALELAQAQGEENARQLGIISAQLDAERWQAERRKLVSGGTPPFIADLAQPLLEGSGHVVDLAGGNSVDAGQIMRKVLAEYGKIVTQLGLETGAELGTAMDEPEQHGQGEAERDDIVKRARAQLGI